MKLLTKNRLIVNLLKILKPQIKAKRHASATCILKRAPDIFSAVFPPPNSMILSAMGWHKRSLGLRASRAYTAEHKGGKLRGKEERGQETVMVCQGLMYEKTGELEHGIQSISP